MVFESAVTEILNKVLGDYVLNLDKKQLKIGIWGGDVELHNLKLRENALDDLNLPVQLTHGYLGKLVLKIPWKNLYSQPVVAQIEDFYVVVSPKQSVQYDAEKEAVYDLQSKQSSLQKIEDARKQELEKDKTKSDQSFTEKLTAQIVNNLQVKITNVHIRYEDNVTAGQPFSFGITMHELDIYTTDSNWEKSYITEQISRVFKIANLDSLSIYMNCGDEKYNIESNNLNQLFKSNIAVKDQTPKNTYIFGPISSMAKLQLNMNPHQDVPAFVIPKIDLDVDVDKLNVGITRKQFQTLLGLGDSVNRMQLGLPYRKYRPFNTSFKGNYKKWWKFAITAVLEEDVRRRRRNWSWDNIKEHRELGVTYANSFKELQLSKKSSANLIETCNLCEQKLDLFNLILIRNRVHLEIGKLKQEQEEKASQKGSWFGWFSKSNKNDEAESGDIFKKFEAAMTADEKEKLCRAIGYQENATDTTMPENYEAIKMNFRLNALEVGVYDDIPAGAHDNLQNELKIIMLLKFSLTSCGVTQRPAANALKVVAGMKELQLTGVRNGNIEPILVKSIVASEHNLLDIYFETNPIDKKCDQRIKMSARPLQIVYDFKTVTELVDIFVPPTSVNLSELEDAASQSFLDFKERSATGIQYMVDKHAILDVDINFMPNILIIPRDGVFESDKSLIVISLGQLHVVTEPRKQSHDISKMLGAGYKQDDILQNMMNSAYDKFKISIENVQILIVKPNESWRDELLRPKSDLQVLRPTSLIVTADICVIDNDPRLPKTKVSILLPAIHIGVTEERMLEAMYLLKSLPLPGGDDKIRPAPLNKSSQNASRLSVLRLLDQERTNVKNKQAKMEKTLPSEMVQYTNLEMNFVLNEIGIILYKSKNVSDNQEDSHSDNYGTPVGDMEDTLALVPNESGCTTNDKNELLSLQILKIEINMSKRFYDLSAIIKLGAINLTQYTDDQIHTIIDTPRFTSDLQYLLNISYIMVDKKSPEFVTKHGATEQLVNVDFSALSVTLHQQCLLKLFEMANNLQKKLDKINKTLQYNKDRIATTFENDDIIKSPSNSQRFRNIAELKQEKSRRKKDLNDIISIKFNANMEQVAVEIIGLKRPLASLKIQQLFAGVVLKESSTELDVGLKNILVTDLNPSSVHTTILSIVGKDALKCKVILYNNDLISNYNTYDLKIDVTVGCIKVVFLNFFCMSVLDFMNNFQTVQKALAEASAAAADAAKQNVVNVYEKATKMKFNVQVKAPIVIVPIDSMSLECILFDLGYLNICNNCTDVLVEEDERSPAVLDDIKVDLKNMKLSAASILETNKSGDISISSPDESISNVMGLGQHTNILDPISFNLSVQRNLSSSWYKEKPDLNVSGHLDSIKVNLTTNDYSLLMTILNKNLTEGQDEFNFTNDESHLQKTSVEVVSAETQNISDAKTESTAAEKSEIYEQLKFNFQFDGVVLNLYTDVGEGLSTFGFYFLSLKGKKYDDGTLSTSIVLCDVQLDDNRNTSKSKLTKYLCRKETKTVSTALQRNDNLLEPSKYMLDVTVLLKENDTFAEVRVCGFDLILSIDFLLKIAEFFALPQENSATTSNQLEEKATTKNKPKKQLGTAENKVVANNKMKLVLHIEEPDIILIDTLEDVNAHAIIFNAQVDLTYRAIGEKQLINGEITELKMYMCSFMPEKREATKHFIIHPCVISLQGSTPENHGLHIFLKLSDIMINISPATIELINKAVTTVTGSTEQKNIVCSKDENHKDIWTVQHFNEHDFWFMKCEKAIDALELVELTTCEEINKKPEKCVIEVPSVILVFETGIGYYTSPMLFIETKLSATVSDWSQQMKVDGSFSISMNYYNNSQAIWEPLIEPNERVDKHGQSIYEPWELNFALDFNSKHTDLNDAENDEPLTKIKIYSEKTLEMTISKTSYELLQVLGEAFSQAIDSKGLVKPDVVAPYVIENDTGFDLNIDFTKSVFTLHECHTPNANKQNQSLNSSLVLVTSSSNPSFHMNDIKACTISNGGKAYLQTKQLSDLNPEAVDLDQSENTIYVKVGGIEKELALSVSKSDQRYFCLNRDVNHDPWGIVSEVVSQYGTTKINVHSIVKIHNHFTTTLSVYRLNQKKNEKLLVGEIAPGELFNVPLHSIYTDIKELYFALPGYNCSVQGIKWNDSPTDASYSRQIQCDPIGTFEPLYINAVREKTEIFYENTSKITILSAYYTIHLRPSLYLRNALPIDICISVAGCSVRNDCITKGMEVEEHDRKSGIKEDILDYGEKNVRPGDVLQLPIVKVSKRPQESKSFIVIRLVDYLEKHWSCTTEISENHNEFETWTFSSYDSVVKMDMDLGIRFEDRHGSLELTIFSPFWMINKTGLMLSYKANTESSNVLYHPPEYNGPILFSLREKNFFGKKRASIRVDNSDWSDKIPLDVAGSVGQVSCKSNDMSYQIGVHNHFTSNSLTKQITFIPFYTIINKCEFAIEVQDACRPADPWTKMDPNSCVPLWPKSDAQNLLIARVVGDPQTTIPFKYTEAQCTLLKLQNNRVGGINVDVQTTEGGIYVTLTQYYHGDAPGLIINHTKNPITFNEKGNPNTCTVDGNQKLLFTWTDNTKEKLLIFNNDEKLVSDLRRDQIGLFDECEQIYWVSFLDGLQRVLLITYSEEVAKNGESSTNLQRINEEIEISIYGIGFSLVNNVTGTDILYIGITSSGVIWEARKLDKKRFKQMKIAQTSILEGRYQQYICDTQVGAKNSYYLDSVKTQIDFEHMILHKSPQRQIRRTFYPGVWVLLKTSPYQSQLHVKINRIQIDNQLTDCVFPVVLAPIPPPKSVADSTELKPFVECSIVQRVVPNSTVKQFKYCSILVQEFDIKVDLIFLTAIADIFAHELNDEQAAKLFSNDVESIKNPLSSLITSHSQLEQKNFYDNLHLGPLKIHVSFSMAGSETKALPGILSVIVQSVGVTLTDVNDVVFKLAFFERQYQFFTQQNLISEITSHYAGQALKQLYVLVLGLDILGNPYGLVVGISKGVEDLFYEPFQGAIQGPGEFAEGLVLGVKSLFGHTVGGAAGAVSKITGAMGKCLAVLTFDEDYQKKRRQAINRKPTTFNEGIARSSKGLVMGVVDGVTGVFTKPISGAKEEGMQGFFKGLGQGAIGLVARPTAGVIDFTSGSLEAVKRATEDNEDTLRLRPPRFFSSDNILKPYSHTDAQGNKLLKEIEKGKYAKTDVFNHCEEVIKKHEMLLISNNRVIYAIKNDIFGNWNIKWVYRWAEIQSVTSCDSGVIIKLKKEGPKIMGLFSSSEEHKKIIHIPAKVKRDKLTELMENLRKEI